MLEYKPNLDLGGMRMRTVGILKELKMQKQYTRINLILYSVSICLWMFVISFSFVKLFCNPVFGNGLLLEISVISIIICGYLFIKNKKRLENIKQKENEIEAIKKYRNRYI